MDAGEWLYRSTLLSYLYGMGLDMVTEAEPHTSRGRADIRVTFRNRVLIMEFKVTHSNATAEDSAKEALEQIVKKGYADRYPNAILLGMAIDKENRKISNHQMRAVLAVEARYARKRPEK